MSAPSRAALGARSMAHHRDFGTTEGELDV